MESFNYALHSKASSIYQKQAVIKLIVKKDHDKQYIKKLETNNIVKYWRKILSKLFQTL